MFNTIHVDRVIASVVANPELWAAVNQNDPRVNILTGDSELKIWLKTHALATSIDHGVTLQMLRDRLATTFGSERRAQWTPAWDSADDAVITLVAYHECAYMLDSNPGELAIIAALGDDRAYMLLPACQVFAKEKECVSILTV